MPFHVMVAKFGGMGLPRRAGPRPLRRQTHQSRTLVRPARPDGVVRVRLRQPQRRPHRGRRLARDRDALNRRRDQRRTELAGHRWAGGARGPSPAGLRLSGSSSAQRRGRSAMRTVSVSHSSRTRLHCAIARIANDFGMHFELPLVVTRVLPALESGMSARPLAIVVAVTAVAMCACAADVSIPTGHAAATSLPTQQRRYHDQRRSDGDRHSSDSAIDHSDPSGSLTDPGGCARAIGGAADRIAGSPTTRDRHDDALGVVVGAAVGDGGGDDDGVEAVAR